MQDKVFSLVFVAVVAATVFGMYSHFQFVDNRAVQAVIEEVTNG